MKKDIVFMGAKDIGLQCLEYLYSQKDDLNINIVGVLTNTRGIALKEFSKKNNIPVIDTLDEYLSINDFDILISVQYHLILKKEHISKAKEVAVNLHMAPLPRYRGCNQFSYAIINQDTVFGTTIHKMDEGIDSGDIIFQTNFPINNNIWVEELVQITTEKSFELFVNSINDLTSGNYSCKKQTDIKCESSFHLRSEIENLKNINLDWSEEKIKRYIRATYMGGFEPPYFYLENKKVYFSKEFIK